MKRLPSPTSVSDVGAMSQFEMCLTFSQTTECVKSQKIQQCLKQDPVPLWELRELALSEGGLMNATFRRIAWPLLVGVTINSIGAPILPLTQVSETDRSLLRHDSTRSVLNKYQNQSCAGKTAQDLLHVLESVLGAQPRYGSIRYFQGMHDIASVLLYNLEDNDDAIAVLKRLCRSHLREALRNDDFVSLLSFLKATLLPLLQKFDPILHDFLSSDDIMLPTLVLPWIITWCLHEIADPQASSRLVDALLCGHASFILYLVIALLVAGRDEILNCTVADGDDDPMTIIICIKRLASMIVSDVTDCNDGGFRAQDLIDNALILLHQVHPRRLVCLAQDYHGRQYEPVMSSFFWRAVPSWALSEFSENKAWSIPPRSEPTNVDRAKVASGVTHLTRTVVEFPSKKQQHEDNPLQQNVTWSARFHWFIQYLRFRKAVSES